MSDAAAIIHAHPPEAYGEVAVPFWRCLPEHVRREAGAVLEEVAHGPRTITAEVDGEVVGLVEVPELAVALNDRAMLGGVRRLVSPTVIVRPEHRRGGIGDALMHACAAMVRTDGHLLVAQVLDFRRKAPIALALRHADLISAACWSAEVMRAGVTWKPFWARPDLPGDIKALLDRGGLLPPPVDLTPENAHELVLAWLTTVTLSQAMTTGRVPGFLAAYRGLLRQIDHGMTRRDFALLVERSMQRMTRTRSIEALTAAVEEEVKLLRALAAAPSANGDA
jgi:GNAT superfamily N-acetyltransferase